MPHKKFSSIESPEKHFSLQPDIVMSKSSETIILDTKWKNLKNKGKTYGISQSDISQMYAYGKKYNKVNKIYLIYPYNDEFKIPQQTSDKTSNFLQKLNNTKSLRSGFKFEEDGEDNKAGLELNILLWDLAGNLNR